MTASPIEEQRRQALEQANAVRVERARILRELRHGHVRFPNLDLDAPVLQGLTVFKLCEALRIWSDRSSTEFRRGKATRQADRIVRTMGIGYATKLGDLSTARRKQLVMIVGDVIPSQR